MKVNEGPSSSSKYKIRVKLTAFVVLFAHFGALTAWISIYFHYMQISDPYIQHYFCVLSEIKSHMELELEFCE